MSLQPHQTVARYLFTVLVVNVSLLHQQLSLLSTLLFLIIILLQPVETSFKFAANRSKCAVSAYLLCCMHSSRCIFSHFLQTVLLPSFPCANAHEQNANFITLSLSRHIHAHVLNLFVLCFPLGYFVFLQHHHCCFVLLKSLNFLKVFVVNFNPLAFGGENIRANC